MKKLLPLLCLVLIIACLFSACGEYNRPPAGNIPGTPDDPGTGEQPGIKDPDGYTFKVSFTYGGAVYIPWNPITVKWSDGYSYYTAQTDANGVATVNGLDGDYQITLTDLPAGYTYNPNIYRATNDTPNIEVELVNVTTTSGGTGLYGSDIITLRSMGVYRVNLTGDSSGLNFANMNNDKYAEMHEGKMRFFQFTPRNAGTYVIESWVSVADDRVNPIIEVYTGSTAAKFYQERHEGGGISGNYTRNFRWEISVDDEEIGGATAFIFAVRVTSKTDVYPVEFDFSLSFKSAYDVVHPPDDWAMANELYALIRKQYTEMRTACKTFDGFWEYPIYHDGDSWHDVYDRTEDNPSTPDVNEKEQLKQNCEAAYAAMLATDVNALGDQEMFRFFNGNGTLDTTVDCLMSKAYGYHDGGSWVGAEDVINGQHFFLTENYKLNEATGFYHRYSETDYADDPYGYGVGFGPILYAQLSTPTRFMDMPFHIIEYQGNKALTLYGMNYKMFIEGYDNINTNLQSIPGNAGFTNCPEGLVDLRGYYDYTVDGGLFPVTQEVKDFLQNYSTFHRLFNDGNGVAEWYEPRFDAGDLDQWLFACGYYM